MEATPTRETEAEAVPLQSLEPKTTPQEPFPAIEEVGKQSEYLNLPRLAYMY